ncbi:MAG: DUF5723 family protein [Bacteroidota bacterium]
MKLTISLLLLFNFFVSLSQESYGSLHSNYMPTNSVLINPSSILDAKTRIDINIASIGTFLMNNMAFLGNTSLVSYIDDKDYERNLDFTIDNTNRKNHLYNRINFQGPGFVFSQGDHAFGLGLGVKSYNDVRNVPQKVMEAISSSEIPLNEAFRAKKMAFTSITYGDIKLSYAHTFYKKKRKLLMGGISLSKFIPIQAFASKVDLLEFQVNSDSTGFVGSMNSNTSILSARRGVFSSGFGIDLGFTYQRMKYEAYNYYPNSPKSNCRKVYYLYKIGASIMDIGKLKFQQDDLDFEGVEASNYNWNRETTSDLDINFINQFYEVSTDDESTAFIKNLRKVRLPTYFSLQGDYNVWGNRFYLNLTAVQRMPLGRKSYGVLRANSLCLTPRYETKFLEFALPLSLYEYKTPQIGFTMRLWFLTIGTDKLMTILVDSDVYGADIYFALKVPIVYHPKCKNGKLDRFNYYPKIFKRNRNGCKMNL